MVDERELRAKIKELAAEHEVPGVAVGVYTAGAEQFAFHGITSVENPLEVNADTLFQFGSTGKTFTATAIMRLVDQGQVALDAPVRRYLPEFRLKDEDVAVQVTVLHLLNHTAGWQGDLMENTGDGDDALEKYVTKMADLDQESPLGSTVSYNNASLSVAGRIIERVTGKVYEQAIKELIFVPLGLDHSFFFPNDIMTRRFAVGHERHQDGRVTVSRPWALPRGNSPAGGISSNAGDQVRWARFHLGDGTTPDGTRLLSEELLRRMQEPTAEMQGSALGDYVGISWLLRDVDGVRLVAHGGTTNGQHSEFLMAPVRQFAIASLTNCGPNGADLNHVLLRWALQAYVGVDDREPEPITLDDTDLEQYVGVYETIAAVVSIRPESGRLLAKVKIRPEVLAQIREGGQDAEEDEPPVPLALLSGPADRYVVSEGPGKGMKGYFRRNAAGEIDGVHFGGRLATRTGTVELEPV